MTDKKEVIHWEDEELIWASDIPYTYECNRPDPDGVSTIADITVVHVHGEGPVPVMEFITRALGLGVLIKWPSVFRTTS